jgi:protein TonB
MMRRYDVRKRRGQDVQAQRRHDMHAPLAVPTYLIHVTAPVFSTRRAAILAIALHAAAVVMVLLILHHRFTTAEPQDATVALVIEPSPYVGSGPNIITPVTPPHPRAIRPAVPHVVPAAATPADATQSSPDIAAVRTVADLPLPAPPQPPAPRPQPAARPRPAAAPAPHQGNNQPAGYGLVVSTKIIPAAPDARVNAPPAYPPEALAHGEQGRVLLSIQVEPSGRASAVRIVASSGFLVLDEAARDAVLGWQFLPANCNGRAVPSMLLLPVKFEIDPATNNVQ